ncbi:hypothetical protein KBD49_05060 [Myxococcota bacterium]|nr:hypothetical protein [Myxococcota bacterium]
MERTVAIYGVAGLPVVHSRSPALFRQWFGPRSDRAYLAIQVRDRASLQRIRDQAPLAGFNVTRPWKEAVAKGDLALEAEARATGAVNVVFRDRDGCWRGDNTDVAGVREVLRSCVPGWQGRKVLLLGAGGAARAVARVVRAGSCPLVVLNRTRDRARRLARDAGGEGDGLDRLGRWLPGADLVVSTLPPSAAPDLSLEGIRPGTPWIDAGYLPSPLEQEAAARQVRWIRGTTWLLAQARATHRLWFGTLPSRREGIRVLEQSPAALRRIALVGFMGSGKTALGERLARTLGWDFADLDREVEARLGRSIPEIFRESGEAAFRQSEVRALRELGGRDRIVLACGGGTTTVPEARTLLRRHFYGIWAWVSSGEAARRVKEGRGRPLWVADPSGLEALWRIRQEGYARTADLLVDTEAEEAATLAEEIAHEIRLAL